MSELDEHDLNVFFYIQFALNYKVNKKFFIGYQILVKELYPVIGNSIIHCMILTRFILILQKKIIFIAVLSFSWYK